MAQWASAATGILEPPERLLALLEHAVIDRHRCIVWLATTSLASRDTRFVPEIAHIFDAWRSEVMDALQAGVHDGSFDPVIVIDDIADVIVVSIDGLMTGIAVGLDGFEIGRIRQVLRSLSGALLRVSAWTDESQPPVDV